MTLAGEACRRPSYGRRPSCTRNRGSAPSRRSPRGSSGRRAPAETWGRSPPGEPCSRRGRGASPSPPPRRRRTPGGVRRERGNGTRSASSSGWARRATSAGKGRGRDGRDDRRAASRNISPNPEKRRGDRDSRGAVSDARARVTRVVLAHRTSRPCGGSFARGAHLERAEGLTAEARLRVPFVAAASLRAGAVDIIAVVDIVVDVGRGDASLRQPREGLFAQEAFERGWFRRARVLVDARGRRRTNLSTRRKSHTRVSYWSAISRTPKSSPRPNPLLGPALGGSPPRTPLRPPPRAARHG